MPSRTSARTRLLILGPRGGGEPAGQRPGEADRAHHAYVQHYRMLAAAAGGRLLQRG